MIRIKLGSKFLYEVTNKDEMLERHYRNIYLDIGYKGRGISQIYFMTIIQEDYCEIFTYANMLWHSKF